eukprot:TRINITY_DN76678_c0_g1_i1.p1 TRINITY_DN76678_c0_g1~~TRINITY_DN76678_c0_g1_i1.p1  ORF type:complete len:156 (-),score=9.54 TRINITY_DN76678_c0_g1_i1:15-482(-)
MTPTESFGEQQHPEHMAIIMPYPQFLKHVAGSIRKLLFLNLAILGVVLLLSLTSLQEDVRDLPATPYILSGLILYFILYPCLKALIHLTRLYDYNTRLMTWKMQMAETISESDYLNATQYLQKIRTLLRIYPLVLLVHLAIAFTCYYLKHRFLVK